MRTRSNSFLIAISVSVVLGCNPNGDDPSDPNDPPPEARATWHQDVAPIVYQHCVSCHIEGGIAPFALTSYADAQPAAELMLTMVETGVMPPWSAIASDDCAPRHGWKDDPRLSTDEQQLLRAWVEGGAVEGDPDDAAELPEPPSLELENPTHELAPAQPFRAEGFTDLFRCFVLEPQLTATQWVTGVEFVPGNLEITHHAVLVAVPPAQADAVRAKVGPDGTFECVGGIGVQGSYPLAAWLPGAPPGEAPPDSGTPVVAGSVMVMQMHYHPFGNDHAPDRTRVKLRMTSSAPARTFFGSAIGNVDVAPVLQPGIGGELEFVIPAGEADHVETMIFGDAEMPPTTGRVPLVAITPHMHYVGVDLSLKIVRAHPNPGEPAEECLFHTPNWNFDWQRGYSYDAEESELPTVGPGDELILSCRYNNTMANPFVRRMLLEERLDDPIDIELGEETTNEMCAAGLGLLF